MALSPEQRHRRARLAALSRHHPEQVEAERRQLKAASAEKFVRQLRDEWPVLTIQQRADLAALLLAGDGAT